MSASRPCTSQPSRFNLAVVKSSHIIWEDDCRRHGIQVWTRSRVDRREHSSKIKLAAGTHVQRACLLLTSLQRMMRRSMLGRLHVPIEGVVVKHLFALGVLSEFSTPAASTATLKGCSQHMAPQSAPRSSLGTFPKHLADIFARHWFSLNQQRLQALNLSRCKTAGNTTCCLIRSRALQAEKFSQACFGSNVINEKARSYNALGSCDRNCTTQ